MTAQELMEWYDLRVMSDLDTDLRPSYAVGWDGEWQAGVRGGVVTPYFPTAHEAMQYLENNQDAILAAHGWDKE